MELQLVIDKIYQSWDARSTITFHLGNGNYTRGSGSGLGRARKMGHLSCLQICANSAKQMWKDTQPLPVAETLYWKKEEGALWGTSIYLYSHDLFAGCVDCRVLTLRKIYKSITLPPFLQHFILIWFGQNIQWKCCAVVNICPSGVSALYFR